MPRHVFYSFHYDEDNWRASKIRNIGQVEGQKHAFDNAWETVRKNSDVAIRNWITDQMHGRSCVIVLIGAETAGRKWVNFEIEAGWQAGKALLGIYVHGIKDRHGSTTMKGDNPFASFNIKGVGLDRIVPSYDPVGFDSPAKYRYIASNIEEWIDNAINIRKRY